MHYIYRQNTSNNTLHYDADKGISAFLCIQALNENQARDYLEQLNTGLAWKPHMRLENSPQEGMSLTKDSPKTIWTVICDKKRTQGEQYEMFVHSKDGDIYGSLMMVQ